MQYAQQTFDVSVEQVTTSKAPALQARLLARQMHRRIPAWKLKLCVEALNARPIDLVPLLK